jgi:hypothetical protein
MPTPAQQELTLCKAQLPPAAVSGTLARFVTPAT